MRAEPADGRVLQIHPLGRCNLACAHCYSSSSPRATSLLPTALATRAVRDAAAAGYGRLAISGGEPLLYDDLPALIAAARDAGMSVSAATNGTLLDARGLDRVAGLDLLAISLDGAPETHDRMRGKHAFARMVRHLDGLRASGVPFGFAFTLTQHNLHELDWVAAFAVERGAILLHVHPLERAGRAAERLPRARPDGEELQWAILEVLRLQAIHPRLELHVDVLPARSLSDVASDDGTFPGTVRPLVIEADGTVVPFSHGIDRRWALGRLQDAPLDALIAAYAPRLPTLRQAVLRPAVRVPAGMHLVRWNETVAAQARAAPAA